MKKILLAIALLALPACAQSEKELLAMKKACESGGGIYQPKMYNSLVVGAYCHKEGVRFRVDQSGNLRDATILK